MLWWTPRSLSSALSSFLRSMAHRTVSLVSQVSQVKGRVNLGLLLARQRRCQEALDSLVPAIGESAAHHNLGVIAIDCGDEATARQEFSRAASLPSAPKETQEFNAALCVRRAAVSIVPGGRGSCRTKAKLGRSLSLPLKSQAGSFQPAARLTETTANK